MNFDTILLLGSIGIPALGFVLFLCGFPKDESVLKKLAYLVFGFPCIAGDFSLFSGLILQMDIVLNSFMNVWDFMNLALLSILD